MASQHPRTAVRRYAGLLISNNVDVGGRVYLNRPTPIFEGDVPAVFLYYADEPAGLISGSEYFPSVYERGLMLNIDVLVEEQLRPGTQQPLNQDTEDELDALCLQCEKAMFDDLMFAKQLEGYDPNTSAAFDGLLLGMRYIGTSPYNSDGDGDRRIIAAKLQFELPYEYRLQGHKKYDDFNTYYMAIIRIDSDESTTDRELIEAQGDLE